MNGKLGSHISQHTSPLEIVPQNVHSGYPDCMSGEGYVLGEIVHSIDNIVSHLSTIICTEQIEGTKRLEIREQSRCYIASIQADLLKFQDSLRQSSLDRARILSMLYDITTKDSIDEYSRQLAFYFLQYLEHTDPLMNYYKERK